MRPRHVLLLSAVNQYVVFIHVVPHLADYDVLQHLT